MNPLSYAIEHCSKFALKEHHVALFGVIDFLAVTALFVFFACSLNGVLSMLPVATYCCLGGGVGIVLAYVGMLVHAVIYSICPPQKKAN